MNHVHGWIDTPLGTLRASFDARGRLFELVFVEDRAAEGADGARTASRELAQLRAQLDWYFAGKRTRFDVELAPRGTEFQRDVWRVLADVEYGTTTSYAELARRIGRPNAVRAVGAANGANPWVLVVPCHRVIGADGSLTGYAGGLARKRALLELERALPVAR